MNRTLAYALALAACAAAVTSCHRDSGLSRPETAPSAAAEAASSPSAASATTSGGADDPANRVRDTLGSIQDPVFAAAADGIGDYQVQVAPQPSVSGPVGYLAALCTGGPDLAISIDGTALPPASCGDDPREPGVIVSLLAVNADPAIEHTVDVHSAQGQHSWVSLAYGQMY